MSSFRAVSYTYPKILPYFLYIPDPKCVAFPHHRLLFACYCTHIKTFSLKVL